MSDLIERLRETGCKITDEAATALEAAQRVLKAWDEAYPEDGEDCSIEHLWARYGSEFAHAMKLTRDALNEPTSAETK